MIADILDLERRARADLALEARASVDDGVVAEEREGDEEGREWEGAGAAEGCDGDKGLDADGRDGQDAVDFGVCRLCLGAGKARRGLEVA